MKYLKRIVSAVVLVAFISFDFGLAEQRPKIQNETLLALLKKYKINSNDVSLELRDDVDVKVSVNPNQLKIPASVTKILTSFAVLNHYPVGQRFVTQVFYDNKNLYLKGGGDPGFVSENMWYLVNELTRHQLKEITGDIIVDDSLFDRIRFDESREDRRVDRAYDSPVGAMSFNWNAVNIFVKPLKAKEKAQVIIDPENDFFKLKNSTVTVAGIPRKDLVISISSSSSFSKEPVISVSGEVSIKMPEKAYFKSIPDPAIWSGINLKAFLKQRGIQVRGSIQTGVVPESASLLVSVESKPLGLLLADMNKFSNNFVAEMLTKGLAVNEKSKSVSLAAGVEVIKSELKSLGLGEKDFFIENPSGFTRKNQLSANALNQILLHMKRDFTKAPVIMESLPIAGVDGTLKKRFRGTEGQGFVRAKTGYLDGVVSLAGYAGRSDGTVLTFSFLYNGPQDESKVREFFDQILLSSIK